MTNRTAIIERINRLEAQKQASSVLVRFYLGMWQSAKENLAAIKQMEGLDEIAVERVEDMMRDLRGKMSYQESRVATLLDSINEAREELCAE